MSGPAFFSSMKARAAKQSSASLSVSTLPTAPGCSIAARFIGGQTFALQSNRQRKAHRQTGFLLSLGGNSCS